MQRIVLQQLVWPAVAGNVAWSFFTLMLVGNGPQRFERLVLLFLLALYLGTEWSHSYNQSHELKKASWLGDAVLASAIAMLAIAAQDGSRKGFWFLLFVFVASAGAHWYGAWTPSNGRRRWTAKHSWFVLNFFAVLIAGLWSSDCNQWGWNLVIAEALVILCWFFARKTSCKWFDSFRD